MLWHVPAFNSRQISSTLNTRILEIYEDRIIEIFPEFHDQTLNCPTAVMAHIPRIKVANVVSAVKSAQRYRFFDYLKRLKQDVVLNETFRREVISE